MVDGEVMSRFETLDEISREVQIRMSPQAKTCGFELEKEGCRKLSWLDLKFHLQQIFF